MNAEVAHHPPITLRRIAPTVFVPALVYEIGNGAVMPVIALTALHLGASASGAAYMLTLLGIGRVIGDIPSSALANRLGERHAMLIAAIVAVAGQLGCAFAPSLLALGAALFALGLCDATFYLARQSYIVDVAPFHLRARAMSTLAGAHRVGLFIGPFLGAAAISLSGLTAAYFVAALSGLCVVVLILMVPDVESATAGRQPARRTMPTTQLVRNYRQLWCTLGLAVLAVGAVRAGRQVVLPLWAEHIGIGAAATSVVFGIANAVDMLLFYPAGVAMDRSGRRAVALPSMFILGLGTVVLPLTGGIVMFTLVSMLISFGNGIGSGIMLTLGADAAPGENRTTFLSIWRVMSDVGNALGPVVVSVGAAVATLAAGVTGVGSLGILAALGLARWGPRYSEFWRVAPLRRRQRLAGQLASDAAAAP